MFSVRWKKNQQSRALVKAGIKNLTFTNGKKKKTNLEQEQCARQQYGGKGDHTENLRQQLCTPT